MSSNPRLSRAIRIALLTGAATATTGVTLTASAQEGPPADELRETITVTGSRIVRKDFEATSPVVTVGADTFNLSGEVQVETVLNSLPQLVPSITTTSNNPSNGGQANVDLRGLGTQRTLVLLDGTRLPPSNPTGVVDLNTIPSALIESIEILTGGASSVYGSDAIAGVVNVRMKRDFEGVQLSAQSNVTDRSDGRTFLAEAVLGGNFADDRGNAVLALTYDQRDEVLAGARDFGLVSFGPAVIMGVPSIVPVGSGTVPDGRVDWGANVPTQLALDQVFGSYGAANGAVTSAAPIGFNTNGSLFSFGVASNPLDVVNYLGNTADPGFNPDAYSYNFGPVNYLQLPLERRQIAGFARYDVVPDTVEMYTRIMYTTYNSDQQLASTPVTCAGAALGCSIPVTNNTIPTDLRTLLNSRATPAANFTFTKRPLEVGPRFQENSYDVMQGLVGFKGDFDLGDNGYHWDLSGGYGRAQGTSLQDGNVSRSRLQNALNNPAFFAAQGCASFNPFGEGGLSPACARAITIRASNILEYEATQFIGSITGPMFNMWAGSVDFAVGAEYREDVANFRPDEFLASGDVVGFNAQQPVGGRITVIEPFAELIVPLVRDVTAFSYLGLEFGYRNSNYNIAGSYDTYKAALQWSPIESVRLRGSYNRAIRAPSINDLFLPRQENFPQYSDPCNATSAFRTGPNGAQVAALCQAQGIPAANLATFNQPNTQARAFVGGNQQLTPEKADTYTLGVTWQSSAESDWLRLFNISVDYFSYEIEDVIASLAANSIIGRCFNQLDSNPTFDVSAQPCQLFTRNPANFGITDIVTTQLNLSAREVDGIDVNLNWGLPLSAFGADDSAGQLTFQLLATQFMSWKQQEIAIDPFFDRAGTISQTVASAFPEYKAVLATTYQVGPLQFRYNMRYIDGMDVVNNDAVLTPSTSAIPQVDSYLYHDLVAQWDINDTLGMTLGVTNIGDKDPPIYATNAQAGIQSNTDPSTYDVLGRRYFLSLTANF